MSKFIDKLNSITSGGLAPMGFRAAGGKPKPKMALVAHLAKADAKPAGADAMLVSIPKATKSLKKPKAKIPWGGWLREVSREGVKRLGEGGADFIVFPAASVSSAVLEENLGKVVEVEASLDAGLLKAIDDLPVDAVLIAGEKPSLTWQDLMLFRRGANILTKPLLVVVSPDVTASELQALCQAGVAGVVVGGKIDKLRPMIDKLTPPKAGKRRAEPLVPRIGGGVGTVSEEEAEEED